MNSGAFARDYDIFMTSEDKSPRITVTSYAFSQSQTLRRELLAFFPNATFERDRRDRDTGDFIRHLQDSRGLILGRGELNARVLDALPKLEIVSVFGVGLNNLDADHARERGIAVERTPGVNKRSVAEQTLAFMIGLCRNLFANHHALKHGEWREDDGGTDLTGKTVGIVGCGHTGSEVLRVLQPFRCRLIVCDIVDKTTEAERLGARQVECSELLKESDVVSLHIPMNNANRRFIGRRELAQLKSTAVLINMSRGGVVDQNALHDALAEGRLGGAALDVFDPEPPVDKSFLALPNLVVTPHTGGASRDATLAMGRAAIGHIVRHFKI
jgi:D-3-phosphoglycerate dehydrogenase